MSRRFTLFALLTAVCLLFASCGALFLKTPVSNKGSIVIPLRSSDRKASSPLELCTRFVFSIENASYKDTAEGTTTIEFGEIPFGTYTLTGTAYGKLSEETGAQEEIVATCKVENLVIDSPEPKAISAVFTLSESTLIYFNGYTVEENQQGTPVTVVYTGTDKATKISETVTTNTESGTTTTIKEYAIDANGNNTLETNGNLFVTKETVTEPQPSGNKITVTEYDYNNGSPLTSKITVTEPDGKKTISEYNLNATTQGCAKRVTVEEGNTTTVSKYDTDEDSSLKEIEVTQKTSAVTTITTYNGSNWEGDLFAKQVVIDSGNGTTTTTENLSTNKAKTAKVTVEVTSGSDKGKTTVTEYDTAAAGTVRETVTVTNPDHSSVVTTFNDSDKETKKVETDANGVFTITTFNYPETNSSTVTLYKAGHNPSTNESLLEDLSNVVSKVETFIENGSERTVTTSFEYEEGKQRRNSDGDRIPSYDTIVITTKDDSGAIVKTVTKTYSYCDGSANTKPQDLMSCFVETVVENGQTNIYTTNYTYDNLGRIINIISDNENVDPIYYEWLAYSCIVYARNGSMPSSLEALKSSFSSTTPIFKVDGSEEKALRFDVDADGNPIIDEAAVKRFLTNNYVLVSDTSSAISDLEWVTTPTRSRTLKGNGMFKYIYKVDLETFSVKNSGCFGIFIDTNTATAYCVLHNEKTGTNKCPWWTNEGVNGANQQIKWDTNYGSEGNGDGI